MNAFEKIMLALLATATAEAPVFIHSQQGMLVLNAGETLLANILAAFPAKAAVATPVIPVAPVVAAAAA
jgi:hypothetical protein